LILCSSTTVISIVVAVQFVRALRRIAWHAPPDDVLTTPVRLTVIIPARDEEADLARAIDSVLAQAGVEMEVFVINDHSSDRTGAIADERAGCDARLSVIHNPDLPAGWLGKTSAMHQAAMRASGEVLLFTDADVVHEPRCFVTALAELDRRELDFLSLFPRMDWVSLWENIILPAMVGGVALLATPGIEDPSSPDALAAGAFLMVRSRAFGAVGGLEPVKGEMFDDVALARLIKRHGYRVGLRAAPSLLHVRLYKGNRHAFWGMTKNVLEGLGGRLWLAPFVMLLPVFVFWVPIFCALQGAAEANAILVLAGAATYGIQYANLWCGRRLFRFHPAKALLFPLVAIPVLSCLGWALYLYVCRGAVQWRGRTIRVRQGGMGR
jgi:glycosyltransferase involved in cell wall biosynthesis